MATQDEIKAWFAANPGASDAQIAQAMKQNGVGTLQVSQATGTSDDDVTRRYNAAMGLPEWDNRNLPAGVTRTPAAPQYTTLSANSNPADVAGAYRQWSGANGGDTQANRDTAQGYLSNLGMGNGAINEAYNQYKGGGGGGGPVVGGGGPMPGGGQMPGGQGAQPGGQNLGMGQPMGQGGGGYGGGYGGGQNPYLRSMGIDIGTQLADTWNRQILPGTRSSAMAAGGFGGSRQGVVEANALNDLGRNYVSGMTNLYGGDWTNNQNRNLQNKGLDQSYDLGLRNNDLGFGQLDSSIYQNNFNNSLQSANFGLGVQDYLNKNNTAGINAGTQMQNTAAEYQKYLNNAGNAAGGAGGTRIGTTVS